MPSVFIYKYNNYNNRQLKKENTLTDYGNYVYAETGTSVNFNPSDNVSAYFNCGRQNNPYYADGDYLIYSNDNTSITSRWFITEQTRIREGQWKVSLRRDVVAEHWNEVIGSPMFIEKATLPDTSPFIYNSENMTVNQIKQGPDYLIKDETAMPWICGYFVPGKEMTAATAGSKYDRVIAGIENDPYYQYTNNDFMGPPSRYSYQICGHGMKTTSQSGDQTGVVISVGPYDKNNTAFKKGDNVFSGIFNDFYSDSVSNSQEYPTYFNYTFKSSSNYYFWDYQIEIWNKLKTYEATLFNAIKSYIPYNTQADYNSLVNATNDIIYDTNSQKYYKMRIVSQGNKTVSKLAPGTIASTIINANIFTISGIEKSNYSDKYPSGINESRSIGVTATVPCYRVVYDEVQGDSISLTISATAKKVNDAPYAIFAMPYGSLDIYDGTTKKCTTNAEIQMNMATELFRKYGSGDGRILYDLTLMPYCPCRGAITADGKFDISDYDVSYLTKENASVGVAIMVKSSTFSLSLTHNIPLTNKKMDNETEVYRIVSPDYSSQFDFNIAKNGGLSGFNIDCTYRPWTPYVQVAPIFNDLYGSDWQDGRGLICGFSFSLPVLSNAWESYQLANVNFQKMFDRETQHLEVQNKYQNIQQLISSVMGAGTTGVLAGITMGPIAGLAAGIGSAIGGAADYAITKKLQGEALDYRQDMFGYQLGTIKALPNSLAKIGAFVANNKIFPFLEHFTCTEEEKQAVANKIAWNGMTVGAIGILNDYINNEWSYGSITDKGYVKGKLIRFDGCDDAHELETLQNELYEGVYLK